jgi:tRNA threonylcarbamoyl adenosine modification protein YjeE
MNEDVVVETAAQMRDLGRELAALLRPGDLVIMSGPLGAGKTTLTQGIGAGLGVRGLVTSPTFVIARVHPGPTPLVHADAYRLGSALELDDLDLDADTDTSVTVVEWGEGLAEELAANRLEITIVPAEAAESGSAQDGETADPGDQPRAVRVRGIGKRWEDTRMTRADVIDRL